MGYGDTVRYSGIQLDTARYVRIQLDTVDSGIQRDSEIQYVDLLQNGWILDRYRDTRGIPRIR